MGRCLACNKNLSDAEATRKSATTGEYIDLCNGCYRTIADDVPTIDGSGTDGETCSEGTNEDTQGYSGTRDPYAES